MKGTIPTENRYISVSRQKTFDKLVVYGVTIVIMKADTHGQLLYAYEKRKERTRNFVPMKHCYSLQHGILFISFVQATIVLGFHGYSILPCLEDTLCPGPLVILIFLPPLRGCSLSLACRDGIVGEPTGSGLPEITYFGMLISCGSL